MKQSNYNFFYRLDDGLLAYNARTNAMAVVEQEKERELSRILNGEESEDKKFVDELIYGGFLIADTTDELKNIRHDMYASRFSNRCLSLTIAPTANCNFRCPYCYEKDVLHIQRMGDDTEEKLVNFVAHQLNSIEQLDVTWYGGEPLLEYPRILNLSQQFMKLCEEHKVIYSAGMVTNGYLLTKERLGELIKCRISSIQITLDGMKETHDNRRYLRNHGGTFDRIMENLQSFEDLAKKKEDFPQISIRINVDRSNSKQAFELLEYIANLPLKSYVFPYVADVYIPADVNYENTLNGSEYENLKEKFVKEAEKKGFLMGERAFYPQRVTSSCGCDQINTLVVDANGNLYKCWEEIGDTELCVGHLGEEQTYNLPQRYYDYMLYDPTLDEKCSGCEILPVCMGGGCPIRRERDHRSDCRSRKECFESNMRNSAERFGKVIGERVAL